MISLQIATEKQFTQLMVHFLRINGLQVYHTWNAQHSAAGFPDIVAVGHEHALALELKLDGKYPTEAQQRWLDALGTVPGIISGCLHPAEFAPFQTFVQRLRLHGSPPQAPSGAVVPW